MDGDESKELQAEYAIFPHAKVSWRHTKTNYWYSKSRVRNTFLANPPYNWEPFSCKNNFSGNGVISILDATELTTNHSFICHFFALAASELFETLPETGDSDRPKLVLFFDEAHLLFDPATQGIGG